MGHAAGGWYGVEVDVVKGGEGEVYNRCVNGMQYPEPQLVKHKTGLGNPSDLTL